MLSEGIFFILNLTWFYKWQCQSVCWSVCKLIHHFGPVWDISAQLLDGLAWNFIQTFMIPRGWIPKGFADFPFHLAPLRRCGSDWSNKWTTIGYIAMKLATDIQGPLRTNSSDFDNPPWLSDIACCLVHVLAQHFVMTFMVLRWSYVYPNDNVDPWLFIWCHQICPVLWFMARYLQNYFLYIVLSANQQMLAC